MSLNKDQITTLAGGISGLGLILVAFGILTPEKHSKLAEATPLIVSAIALVVQGYFTNKTD